ANAGDIPAGAVGQWPFAYGTPFNPPSGTYHTDVNGSTTCGGTGQLPCSATVVPVTSFDPNVQDPSSSFRNLYPVPNVTPSAGNGWNNYTFVQHVPQNRWEGTGKVDYAINDNTKLTVSY